MSIVDSKFPGQRPSGLPPSPSRENPGQFFPQSDPQAAPRESVSATAGDHDPPAPQMLGNPYVLDESFTKLDRALTEVISKITSEESSVGAAPDQDALVRKLSGWRDELDQIRSGQRGVQGQGQGTGGNPDSAAEGGLFAD